MNNTHHDLVAEAFRSAMQLPNHFELRDEMGYDNIPGWDSLAHMRLIVELEDRCGISLGMDEIAMIDSVGAARKAVAQKQAG